MDETYRPVAHANSTRWNADVNDRQFELLLTGPKFWDTRAKQGGGGAVDLVMYLMPCDFKEAVALLRARQL